MPKRRYIIAGDSYTIDEDIELDIPEPNPDPPPEETRGEPWGWTKLLEPKPRGWRRDGNYGGQNRDDPGPYDGEWERNS
jgi:hypothetical protein